MKKLKNRKVIYSCISGRYDELSDHTFISPEWDYVCFSDVNLSNDRNSSWKILPLKFDELDNSRNQRWHKINPHELFEDYDISLYVDANINIIDQKFFSILNNCIKDKKVTLAFPPHPQRDCVYDEVKACEDLKKDDPHIMEEFVKYVSGQNFPRNNGLYATGIILRRHQNEEVRSIMTEWWSYVRDYSKRDQLSLPYVLWKNDKKPDLIDINIFNRRDGLLHFWPHNEKARDVIRALELQLEECRNQ